MALLRFVVGAAWTSAAERRTRMLARRPEKESASCMVRTGRGRCNLTEETQDKGEHKDPALRNVQNGRKREEGEWQSSRSHKVFIPTLDCCQRSGMDPRKSEPRVACPGSGPLPDEGETCRWLSISPQLQSNHLEQAQNRTCSFRHVPAGASRRPFRVRKRSSSCCRCPVTVLLPATKLQPQRGGHF